MEEIPLLLMLNVVVDLSSGLVLSLFSTEITRGHVKTKNRIISAIGRIKLLTQVSQFFKMLKTK